MITKMVHLGLEGIKVEYDSWDREWNLLAVIGRNESLNDNDGGSHLSAEGGWIAPFSRWPVTVTSAAPSSLREAKAKLLQSTNEKLEMKGVHAWRKNGFIPNVDLLLNGLKSQRRI